VSARALPSAVADGIGEVHALIERNGLPNGRAPVPCSVVCDELWLSEHRPMPNQPSSDDLHREIRLLRERSRLLPRAASIIGNVAFRGSAVGTAGLIGWEIGTAARKLLLEVPVPVREDAVTHGRFEARGALLLSSGHGHLMYAPSDGFVGADSAGFTIYSSSGTDGCWYYGSTTPAWAGFTVLTETRTTTCNGAGTVTHNIPFAAVVPRVRSLAQGEVGSQGSIAWPNSREPGTNGEPTATTRDRMRGELENAADSYPTLLPWLDSHLGGGSEDPTGQLVKVPACRSDSYETCVNRLEANGLTGQRVELTFDDADLDVAPDRIVRTSPASGVQAPAASSVTVYVNPPEDLVRVPACRGESYQICVSQLNTEGLTARRVELDFDGADPDVPAERVVRTQPAKHTPVGSEVVAYVNPVAANMPAVIPGIQPGETYHEYADRLRELELEPVREDVTEITTHYGPDGAISSRPGAGTRTRKGTEVVVVTRPRRQRCDLSDPLDDPYIDGGVNTPMQLFTGDPPRYPFGANPVFLTPRNLLRTHTVLRWGTATPQPPPELWSGFGYRKIVAKHGWSLADEAATRDVLSTAQPTQEPGNRGNDRWTFIGQPYGGRDGRPCVRVVVVDYDPPPGMTEAEGIITSFGSDPR
jgi:hypothetical protein